MTTPEFMPVISAGAHRCPAEGACVMEYISMLAGERWSDRPSCTHPVLAVVARRVNDLLPDDERHKMIPYINRLFGTGDISDWQLSVDLANWCEAYADAAGEGDADDYRVPLSIINDALDAAAYVSRHSFAVFKPQFLEELLDEYDRLTGRTETEDVCARLPEVAEKVSS